MSNPLNNRVVLTKSVARAYTAEIGQSKERAVEPKQEAVVRERMRTLGGRK
jgi:hypothetical protein